MTEEQLEEYARVLRTSAYNAYTNTLVGTAPQCIYDAGARMKAPVVGDWVIETSTIYMNGRSPLDAVGILEEAGREPVVWSDPDFVWDEEEQGVPHPTEQVWYIRTLDGRRFRWTNASIIAILSERRPF